MVVFTKIFNQPEMRQKLGLLPAADFHFLAQSKMFTCVQRTPAMQTRHTTVQM
jgi:hypothetical protein